MAELSTIIPQAHAALTQARYHDLARIDQSVLSFGVTGVHGEPEVGVTTVTGEALRRTGQGIIRVDLDGAAGGADVAWYLARGAARWIIGSTDLSLLLGPTELQPTSARRAYLRLVDQLGENIATLAVSDQPSEQTLEVPEVLDVVGRISGPAPAPPIVWIDHLQAPALTPRHPIDVAALLWSVRAVQQRSELPVVLSGARAVTAIAHGQSSAFYGDGAWITLGRPGTDAWQHVASAIGLAVSAEWIRELAMIAEAHPPTMLLALSLARLLAKEASSPLAVWNTMLSLDDGHTARAVQHARTLHRLGGRLFEQIARGIGPYQDLGGVPPKEINKVVRRLHEAGLITRPAPRTWALTNPLVAARLRGVLPRTAAEASPTGALELTPADLRQG